MRVISKKPIREFCNVHPEALSAMQHWYNVVSSHKFASFAELRAIFPHADKVGARVVFNVGGNKYRIISGVDYEKNRVFVRHVFTHAEYDKGLWKQ
jgi:mRNA interferase HigB